jgi:hypothetical protein
VDSSTPSCLPHSTSQHVSSPPRCNSVSDGMVTAGPGAHRHANLLSSTSLGVALHGGGDPLVAMDT